MKKKILVMLSIITCMFSCFFVGCKESENGSDSSSVNGGNSSSSSNSSSETELTFTVEQTLDIAIEESHVLTPKLGDVSVSGVTFESSNPSVATVNRDGNVTGVSCGSATITATFNDYVATTTVNVGVGENVPYIVMDNLSEEDKLDVSKNDAFDFVVKVMYGGKLYDDVTASVTVDNQDVGTVNGTVFTAKAVGACNVTVTASWRGVESASLTQTVAITVYSTTTLLLNGNAYEEYVLYTAATHAEQNYETQLPLDCVATVDGEAVAYDLSITEGEEVIALNGETVNALKAGSGVVKLSIEVDGHRVERTLTVHVKKPLAELPVAYTLPFDIRVGTLNTQAIFGRETTIVEAYENGTPFTVEQGKIKDAFVYLDAAKANRTFEVYDETVGYVVNLTIANEEAIVAGFHTPQALNYIAATSAENETRKNCSVAANADKAYTYPGQDGSLKVTTGSKTAFFSLGSDLIDINAQDSDGKYLYDYFHFYVYLATDTTAVMDINYADTARPSLAYGKWTEIKAVRNGNTFTLNGVNMFTNQNYLTVQADNMRLRFLPNEANTTFYVSAICAGKQQNEPETVAYFHRDFGTSQVTSMNDTYYGTPTFAYSTDKAHGTDGGSLQVTTVRGGNSQVAGTTENRMKLVAPSITDVSAYDYIYFYVYTDCASLKLTKINSKMHESDLKTFTAGEWNLVKISKRDNGTFMYGYNTLDVLTTAQVSELSLNFCFRYDSEEPITFYISPIRVSNTDPAA